MPNGLAPRSFIELPYICCTLVTGLSQVQPAGNLGSGARRTEPIVVTWPHSASPSSIGLVLPCGTPAPAAFRCTTPPFCSGGLMSNGLRNRSLS
jgi:hypothetical protein